MTKEGENEGKAIFGFPEDAGLSKKNKNEERF